jgi:hypothetical protein
MLIVYKVPLLDSLSIGLFSCFVVAFFGYKFASYSEYFELFMKLGDSVLLHNKYSYV